MSVKWPTLISEQLLMLFYILLSTGAFKNKVATRNLARI
ncbi:hypothetical protein SAOR_10395 [Salinisphaera orenii MK-B5]|uniref:Uncharacterized protein n=1 Tax=Salinisphaera orenii MK-B5 TaxID=856730 RepID=A0A423PLF5_9GAMM|nr:hypothetical protein SAOR_10395 [Salinisphaera orenii MK-B5]